MIVHHLHACVAYIKQIKCEHKMSTQSQILLIGSCSLEFRLFLASSKEWRVETSLEKGLGIDSRVWVTN